MVASLANVSRRLAMLEREAVSPIGDVPPDPVEFAARVGLDNLDGWQEELLASEAPRILLNITRQGGKSTMSGVLAVHRMEREDRDFSPYVPEGSVQKRFPAP